MKLKCSFELEIEKSTVTLVIVLLQWLSSL